MANDIIDINVTETVDSVSITVNPNLTTVNINKVTGGLNQTLQSVTDLGATTTNNITANKFIKSGGVSNEFLMADGSVSTGGGGGGATNLSPTQTATNFTINSDTGTDATIPLGNGTLAGATLNDYTTAEKNKLAGIATGAEVNVNADWNATSGDAQILNKPTIPSITNLVPYTGATTDVNLGLNDITAQKLIKDGGFDYQFLKADGSVDNNIYLTSADLPATLDLYATTTASDISGYTVLVRNIADTRYNATAVDISTGVITSVGQLVGSLITDANIISGNPGVFDFKTIGNISRTNGTGQAEFFFRIYKRNLAGTETLIAESDYTLPVTNGGYVEFSATALWNDGIFLDTDRVVLKYYANRLASPVGSDPTYQFQFGGTSPVRSSAAIPTSVMPNIYLRDLADIENVDALNNEILYWNDADSLWEHSLAENLVPLATATQKGLVSTTTQTIAGTKTFSSNPKIPVNFGNGGIGALVIENGVGQIEVATNYVYPNTTEISYVKGVTSAIQTQFIGKVSTNTAITGDTKTKITYDAKGLVTAGSDIATTDISDFNSATRAQVEAELVAGTNITITPSGTGATRQLTIASTGGGSSSQSAYTILANNTNASAVPTEQPFQNIAQQVYTLTPVWTATTAPSGTTNHTYQWSQIGNTVTVRLNLIYTTTGTVATIVVCPFPTDLPIPLSPSGLTSASANLYYGTGLMTNTNNSQPTTLPTFTSIRRNAANTGYELTMSRASNSPAFVYITIQYFTT